MKINSAFFQEKIVQEVFDKQKKSKLMLNFASYYYALQWYSMANKMTLPSRAAVYTMEPKVLINHVLNEIECNEDQLRSEPVKLLLMYLKKLSDMYQAEMLQGLGKGKYMIVC